MGWQKAEKHLKTKGRKVKTGQFPFMANGSRARAMGDTLELGLQKLSADAEAAGGEEVVRGVARGCIMT